MVQGRLFQLKQPGSDLPFKDVSSSRGWHDSSQPFRPLPVLRLGAVAQPGKPGVYRPGSGSCDYKFAEPNVDGYRIRPF